MQNEGSNIVVALISVASGLVGVLVGAWLTVLREREDRRYRFVRQQIEDFYAPMVGLRNEIIAKSETRVEVRAAAHSGRSERIRSGERSSELQARLDSKDHLSFKAIIDYDNKQLVDELLPAYRQMLALFREKAWLAEESTTAYYQDFFRFVEFWNRWIKDSLPHEAIEKIDHDEDALRPFYSDLEANLKRLRNLLRTANLAKEDLS